MQQDIVTIKPQHVIIVGARVRARVRAGARRAGQVHHATMRSPLDALRRARASSPSLPRSRNARDAGRRPAPPRRCRPPPSRSTPRRGRACCRSARWSTARTGSRRSAPGFVVTADGLALTNYHVVSQYALEPSTYRLEYVAPDGSRGPLKLQAIDVVNDLAVVRLDKPVGDVLRIRPARGRRHDAEGRAPVRDGQSARPRLHDRRGHLQRPRRLQLQRADPLLGRAQSRDERRTDGDRRGTHRRHQCREADARRARELPRAGALRGGAGRDGATERAAHAG